MKYAVISVLVIFCLVSLAAAQPAGLKEASVKMSGKAISVRYTALPAAGGQIAGKPAFLRTDSDLEVQGLAVPKGEYALFIQPDAKEWQLIISRQTGAQAAALNPKMELGRVPMDMKKAASPADTLRMTLASFGNLAGKIELAFGPTIASVPFNLDTIKASSEW